MFATLRKSSFVALALSFAAVLPVHADQWTLLGQQKAGFNADVDTFRVGAGKGRFEALKLRALDNRVAVADVKVHYANGTSEHLNVREHLTPGVTTPAYDLKGQHRLINRIEVLYQTESRQGPRATVQILGLHRDDVQPVPSPSAWEALGSQTVSLAVDHDTINVGASHGRFRMIKLNVLDRAIHLYNLRVTFKNGEVQEFPIHGLVRAGGSTHALDLSGNHRTIARLDMVYKTEPNYGGRQARVTVLGLH
jgi:hypothetical protein